MKDETRPDKPKKLLNLAFNSTVSIGSNKPEIKKATSWMVQEMLNVVITFWEKCRVSKLDGEVTASRLYKIYSE